MTEKSNSFQESSSAYLQGFAGELGYLLKESQVKELRTNSEQFAKCERCEEDVDFDKAPNVSFGGKKLYFCDKCFRAVFKFDKRLKSVGKIWEEGGKKFPFVVRKSSWHGSTYTVVKQLKEVGEAKKKVTFAGDLFLRGNLEKQDQPVGRADAFIWVSWSEEQAKQHAED